ncbi:ATP-binding cassette, subfamily C, bacterial LapB [uncultured Gammaproteobacteria bacterium]
MATTPTPALVMEPGELVLKRLKLFSPAILDGLARRGDLAVCLPAVLAVLGWAGGPRVLAEALPADDQPVDVTEFINIINHFGYDAREETTSVADLGRDQLPCLIMPAKQPAMVVVDADSDRFEVVRGDATGLEWVPRRRLRGKVISLTRRPIEEINPDRPPSADGGHGSWLARQFHPFQTFFTLTVTLTAFANILGLTSSLFVMVVYDTIVPSGDLRSLAMFVIGTSLAIGLELVCRRLRTRSLSYGSVRLAFMVGSSIFQRLLNMPAQLTERASVSAQVARIKDVERVRELLTGPLAQAALDLPFVLVFLLCMLVIGGWLVLVPLLAVVLLAGIGFLMAPSINRRVAEAARAAAQRQELVLEMIEKMASLRTSGGAGVWRERFDALSRTAIHNSFASSTLSGVINSLSYLMSMTAGLATIVYGIHLVFQNSLSAGGLIASTMLTWRILNPVQGALVAFSRVRQLRSSMAQVNSFANFPAERPDGAVSPAIARISGRVALNRVTFRYGRETDPVLGNIAFEVQPGEVTAIIGPNGSGKSTIMKLLIGLYQTQVGSVRIDDRNIRQYDPMELRHVISYVPQRPQLFFGTLAENVRIAAPLATDDEIRAAFGTAGAAKELDDLPDGMATLIDNRTARSLPSSLRGKISLARAYVKRAKIYLFDDAAQGLDDAGEAAFLAALNDLRGKSTVVMITHRPSHVRRADKLLILNAGIVRYFGEVRTVPDQIIRESI